MSLPTKEQLEIATKEQVIELLLLALEGQQAATENLHRLTHLLDHSNKQLRELKDQMATMEAELILLRNRFQT